MTATLPQLNFLTNSSSDTDYRPAVNSTGNVVVFERTPVGGGGALTTLYKITDFKTPNPEPFLSGPNAPAEQTRADWCWKTDQVAFNGASSKDAAPTVWQVGNDGVIQEVPNTEYYSYPTWGLDGSLLVTEIPGTRCRLAIRSLTPLLASRKNTTLTALTPRGQRSLAACRPWGRTTCRRSPTPDSPRYRDGLGQLVRAQNTTRNSTTFSSTRSRTALIQARPWRPTPP